MTSAVVSRVNIPRGGASSVTTGPREMGAMMLTVDHTVKHREEGTTLAASSQALMTL